MIRSMLRKLTLSALLALAPSLSWAVQVLDGTDGDIIYGKISMKEISRLRVQGDKIATVRAKQGSVGIESDRESGQVYLRVMNPGAPVNMFITTDAGRTYTLLLKPEDIPATNIVVRDIRGRPSPATKDDKRPGSDHVGALKQFMLVMARDEIPNDVTMQEKGEKVKLWRDTDFTLERVYQSEEVVGEKYRLTNTGKTRMVMQEPEFYREGVLAVAIERMQLEPSNSTNVFVIRRRGSHDR